MKYYDGDAKLWPEGYYEFDTTINNSIAIIVNAEGAYLFYKSSLLLTPLCTRIYVGDKCKKVS